MRASHIKTFRGHGSFISSNLVGETHVPRNAPGTPQANARFRPARAHARSADESQESGGDCAPRTGSGQKPLRGRAPAQAGWARAQAAWARAQAAWARAEEGWARRARSA